MNVKGNVTASVNEKEGKCDKVLLNKNVFATAVLICFPVVDTIAKATEKVHVVMGVIGHAAEVPIVAANVVEQVAVVSAVLNVAANVEPIGVEVVSTIEKKGKLEVFFYCGKLPKNASLFYLTQVFR